MHALKSIILHPHEIRHLLAHGRATIWRPCKQAMGTGPANAVCRCDADGSWVAWWAYGVRRSPARWHEQTQTCYPKGGGFLCPLGIPGEKRFVKEKFQLTTEVPPWIIYAADSTMRDPKGRDHGHIYQGPWRSPATMPQKYSRLRQLPHLGDAGKGILDYMLALQARLRRVRVCCGEWGRVLTPSCTFRHGMTGILLDPPYGEGEVDYSAGGNRTDIAQDVREWAVANGGNPLLRIALCGYEGQFEMPADWVVEEWKAAGGYSSTAAEETQGKLNRHRERVWFSPACLTTQGVLNFGGTAA